MNKETVFSLNRKAVLSAIIAAAFPVVSHAAAGRVEFAIGNVNALGADGRARVLSKGAEINAGETITTSNGRAQLRFTDGGYVSLQPNSEFKVEDYNFNGKADGSEKGFFSLVKGGLRAITGAIGHTNKTAYRVNTPVATIGIRGTEYTLVEVDGKWLVRVGQGSVFLENQGGSLVLFKGQSAEVADEGTKPQYSDTVPSVTAAAPDGNNPNQTQQEQTDQSEQNNIFIVNEQYNDSGQSVAISNDATVQAMQQYAAASAIGYYDLVDDATNLAQDGNGGTYKLLEGSYLTAVFGSYKVKAELDVADVASLSGGFYYEAAHISASGEITKNTPAFALSGSAHASSGSLCYNGCSFSATGLFKGPTAQEAGIGYKITDTNIPTTTIKGTANFKDPDVPTANRIDPHSL